jgi:5-methylcytosine-specific restriction endonuclease McrA
MKERKDFPASVKKAVRERADYTCENPLGCDKSAVEVDHIIPEGLGGKSTYENARLLCTECHRIKTALDTKMMLKADKRGGRVGQQARRAKAKTAGTNKGIQSKPMAGTKASGLKRKMDGTVVRRNDNV